MANDVLIDKDKCTGCGICAKVCPVNVFDILDKKSVATRSSKCMGCQLCEVECPVGAIKIERAATKSTSPWGKKAVSASPQKVTPAATFATPVVIAQPTPPPVVTAPAIPSPVVAAPLSQVVNQISQKPPSIVTPVTPAPEIRTESAGPKVTPMPASISPPSFGEGAVHPTWPSQGPGVKSPAPVPTTWEYPSIKKPPAHTGVSPVPTVSRVLDASRETPGSTRKILTVVPDLCVNCRICELVCSLKHTGEFTPFKSCVKITYNGHSGPYTPTICRHCHKAACEAACPTKALYYQDGIVLLDRSKCINCLECVRACPFAAIQVGPSGEIYKCDLCGGEPMCAKYCPPRPENTAGSIPHAKGSAIQYVEPHNVTAMRRQGLASSKK